ncbi:MAG TPA: acyl-CoA dehydrogenase, partial [Microbacterium sp.]|nr:acyl-CoA dehydrogenase [Microbacterium sp.]
ATPAGENWTLTGRKVFVSGSEAADHMLVNTSIDGVPAFFGVTV